MMAKKSWHMSMDQGLRKLPGPDPDDPTFATVFKNSSSEVIFYAPRTSDLQEPHDRDEFYVIIGGNGEFINGDTQHYFETGDILFVPANQPHRFVNFSDDLAVWVIFYGSTEDPAFWSQA